MADFAYTQIFSYGPTLALARVIDTPSVFPDADNDDRYEAGDTAPTLGTYLGTVSVAGVTSPVFQGRDADGNPGGFVVIYPGPPLDTAAIPTTRPPLTDAPFPFGPYALVRATPGDDVVFGRFGNDSTILQAGNDLFRGRTGNDFAMGDAGNDTLYGDAGDDELVGGLGNDRLFGGAGDDALRASEGNDRLFGGTGNDNLSGWLGRDLLDGGAGNDTMSGYAGRDTLFGGAGDDGLYGGTGANRIAGGRGNDTLWGGDGRDTFIFAKGDGADLIVDIVPRSETLDLDDALWRGTLTAAQVVRRFGSVEDGRAVLDFGDGDRLTFYNLDSLQGLARAIDIA